MKKLLLILLCLCATSMYSQRRKKKQLNVNKEINIIFESKKEVVLNNGSKYKIIEDTPFYAVGDMSIPLTEIVHDETYRLNRVLLIESDDKDANKQQLIELIKDKTLYYKVRNINKNIEDTSLSGSH